MYPDLHVFRRRLGMDLYWFDQLPVNQKAEMLWSQGNLLMEKEELSYHILLYHLGKFFAEVWYDRKQNTISSIESFKNNQRLDAYLEMVDITSIDK